MSLDSRASLKPPATARLACATGAAGVTALVMASLLGLFHSTSQTTWLLPTPELLALTEACQRLPDPARRLGCTQDAVAAYRGRLARELQLAQMDRPARAPQGAANAEAGVVR